MAVSGGTAALVRAGARKMGVAQKDLASYTNLANAEAFALADGGTKVCNATWSGVESLRSGVWIDWGDGTKEWTANDGSASHTYGTTGAKSAVLKGYGCTMKATVTLS